MGYYVGLRMVIGLSKNRPKVMVGLLLSCLASFIGHAVGIKILAEPILNQEPDLRRLDFTKKTCLGN